jgi:hypothetical protein
MTCGCATMVTITCWISAAEQELLEAAGARVLPDGTRAAPCPRTVSRVLALADPDTVDDCVCRYLAGGERALQAAGPGQDQEQQDQEQGEQESPAGGDPAAEAAEEDEDEDGEPALMPHVTCDGKYVRGARRPDGTTLILLSGRDPRRGHPRPARDPREKQLMPTSALAVSCRVPVYAALAAAVPVVPVACPPPRGIICCPRSPPPGQSPVRKASRLSPGL